MYSSIIPIISCARVLFSFVRGISFIVVGLGVVFSGLFFFCSCIFLENMEFSLFISNAGSSVCVN